jgi:outer membrane protein OmpA-like peptidoglycan-associated protein
VLGAADKLFASVQLPPDAAPPHLLVIDPLVDGVTGTQNSATRSMGSRIGELVRDRYRQFDLEPFSAEAVGRGPLVLVGTFTGLNGEGKPIGEREVYRVYLALADLKTGRVVAKGSARALPGGFDLAPSPYFRDSPAWRQDERVVGYIKTCQASKLGEQLDPAYLDGVLTASLVAEAIEAYDAGNYQQALELYEAAAGTPAGDQLRVYNGLYLANWKLDRREEAARAFAKVVDYGLRYDRLAVKFLFKPGSTAFLPDPEVTEPYGLWLREIADAAARRGSCLEISGHTSPTGPAALNERLSLLRAEYVRSRLVADHPELAPRTITNGVGSRETIIGTGADDATDALDRRVEFKPLAC